MSLYILNNHRFATSFAMEPERAHEPILTSLVFQSELYSNDEVSTEKHIPLELEQIGTDDFLLARRLGFRSPASPLIHR